MVKWRDWFSVFQVVAFSLLSVPVFAQCNQIQNEVFTGNQCTKVRTFVSEAQTEHPNLLITLHGDSPFHNPSYHYRLASIVASKSHNLIAVGMLRPGYSDPDNRTSDGLMGEAVGDNYDKPRIDQIAGAIKKLRQVYQANRVIVAGHSGGSAITAILIAMYPHLIDHAVIVACPCDINQWRSDMAELTNNPIFHGALSVVSPIDLVAKVPVETEISLIVGKDDVVAKPKLSRRYKAALERVGKNATLTLIEGDHEIFLDPSVVDEIGKTVSRF